MIHQDLHHIDASPIGTADLRVAPGNVVDRGQNRLQAAMNTGITTGVHAHAAVRMHVSPVFGTFWAYCPKSEKDHFQRWRVAS